MISAVGLLVKYENLKQLITVRIDLRKMVYSVKEFSGRNETGNVLAESTKERSSRVLSAIDVV
jgi:hypothetical protein